MNKFLERLAVGMIGMTALAAAPSFAAGPVSISTLIGQFAAPIEALPYSGVGVLGNLSIGTSPLGNITLPVLGKGIPLVSTITISNGVVILQSVSMLQKPLPGLELLSAIP